MNLVEIFELENIYYIKIKKKNLFNKDSFSYYKSGKTGLYGPYLIPEREYIVFKSMKAEEEKKKEVSNEIKRTD